MPNVNPAVPGQRYVAWGWTAFSSFIYMVFMASRPIRNRAYQFFHVSPAQTRSDRQRSSTSPSGSSSSGSSLYTGPMSKIGYGRALPCTQRTASPEASMSSITPA